jgi:hypothetical protein
MVGFGVPTLQLVAHLAHRIDPWSLHEREAAHRR